MPGVLPVSAATCRSLPEATLVGRDGILRWRDNLEPVKPDELVSWFDRVFPEQWHMRARRLRVLAEEAEAWGCANRGFNRGYYRTTRRKVRSSAA